MLWADYLRSSGSAPENHAAVAGPMRNSEDDIQGLRDRNFPEHEPSHDAALSDDDSLRGDSDVDDEGDNSQEAVETPLTVWDDDEEDENNEFPPTGWDDATKVDIGVDMLRPSQEWTGLPRESRTAENIQPLFAALSLNMVEEPDDIDGPQKVGEAAAQPTGSNLDDDDDDTTLIIEPAVCQPEDDDDEKPKALLLPYPKQKVSDDVVFKRFLETVQQHIKYKTRKAGFLYVMRRADISDHVKIGYVEEVQEEEEKKYTDPVDNRRTTLTRECRAMHTVLHRVYIPCKAIGRMERLVHMALQEYRYSMRCGSSMCKANKKGHVEWFNVEPAIAVKWVEAVAVFAREMPYNDDGELVKPWSSIANQTLMHEALQRRKRRGRKGKMKEPTSRVGGSVMSWLETILPLLIDSKGKPQICRSETM